MLVVCMGIEAFMAVSTAHAYVKKLVHREFLNTHTMHQVHHAQNIEYMDKTMVVFMFLIEILGLETAR
jgi:hypothetical protein